MHRGSTHFPVKFVNGVCQQEIRLNRPARPPVQVRQVVAAANESHPCVSGADDFQPLDLLRNRSYPNPISGFFERENGSATAERYCTVSVSQS